MAPSSTTPSLTTLPIRQPTTKPKSNTKASKGLWTSLLENTSSGKRLDEKSLVILGGGVQAQNQLLAQFSQSERKDEGALDGRLYRERNEKKPPILANRLALGYTYIDVTDDADPDDVLCRLSVHLLPEAHPAFTTLLEPLFTPSTIAETVAVIMLDWREPWNWMQQLRERIRMLKCVLDGLDEQCQSAIEENMSAWRERRRGPVAEDAAGTSKQASASSSISTAIVGASTRTTVTAGPGEWISPLGIPITIICFNTQTISHLATEYSWRDKQFDTVMQYLRTALLIHGGSLIYTSSLDPGALKPLLRSTLGIQSSLMRKTVLKRNVADRDKVLIPPNWDSWANIGAQSAGFEVEKVHKAWLADIEIPPSRPAPTASADEDTDTGDNNNAKDIFTTNWQRLTHPPSTTTLSIITLYETAIDRPRYPPLISSLAPTPAPPAPILKTPNYQTFLAEQAQKLEHYKQRDDVERQARLARRQQQMRRYVSAGGEEKGLEDRLGRLQFNVGGVEVDAEAAVEALRERAERRARVEETERMGREDKQMEQASAGSTVEGEVRGLAPVGQAGVIQDEQTVARERDKMRAFFASLKATPRS